ncbi:hypothetical protein BDQ12DRAFT_16278 [Crucibulum laeve]|uniref:Uncharacterized protein n=1 Tax=Crucibulum laeve TaxID=68775 RepID=A0A5C3MID4_9AGAR|nr:hypothetical protein BDQ12DRAFT_16278 [Crucibulum laeve]
MAVPLPIIIGVVVAIVVLDLILALSLYISRRKNEAERKRRLIAGVYEKPASVPNPIATYDEPGNKSYMHLMLSINAQRRSMKAATDVTQPRSQRLSRVSHSSNVDRNHFVRSDASISVYSVGSASLDHHASNKVQFTPDLSLVEQASSYTAPYTWPKRTQAMQPAETYNKVYWKRLSGQENDQSSVKPQLVIDVTNSKASQNEPGVPPLMPSLTRQLPSHPSLPPPAIISSRLPQSVGHGTQVPLSQSPPHHISIQISEPPPSVPPRSPLRANPRQR